MARPRCCRGSACRGEGRDRGAARARTAPASRRCSPRSPAPSGGARRDRVRGQEPDAARRATHIVAQGVALVPEGRLVFAPFTRRGQPAPRRGAADAARRANATTSSMRFSRGLRERRRQPAGTLSGGEQQMLAIGRALMSASAPASSGRAVSRPCADGGRADPRRSRQAARQRPDAC